MTKIFNYKIKPIKKMDFMWILLAPIIFIALYKANYIEVAKLFLHSTILLYLKQIIKFMKCSGLWISIMLSYIPINNISAWLFEDEEEDINRIEFKDIMHSMKLCASIGFSSCIAAIGMSQLMYAYSDYNLASIIPAYILLLILLLLVAMRSDRRYTELYHLRVKVKESLSK